MDPLTAFATATAIWGGIKKAVEFGREAEDVWGQLAQWAQAVDAIEQEPEKKPSIFKKINPLDDTKAAFDTYTAKVKIKEQEAEIRHAFLYGSLNHLGMDGLKEFYQIRREIRAKRIKAIQDRKIAKEEFIENCITWGLASIVVAGAISVVWLAIDLLMRFA
jgi:hypothetical protein